MGNVNGDTAIVLGSGLGTLACGVDVRESWGFAEIGLPVSQVSGHEGKMLRGLWQGHELLVMQGRVHLYEGWSAKEVTQGVRWLHEQGVRRLILTNAAGTVCAEHAPGSWMMLNDHLNLTGTSPLEGGAHFCDMTDVYTSLWRERARQCAKKAGIVLHEGVYAGLRGPQYETPAEIRMLRHCGADAVGMSTVLEAIQARALGCEVLGFSCLTNWAAGMSAGELGHAEVVETGRVAADQMLRLLEVLLAE